MIMIDDTIRIPFMSKSIKLDSKVHFKTLAHNLEKLTDKDQQAVFSPVIMIYFPVSNDRYCIEQHDNHDDQSYSLQDLLIAIQDIGLKSYQHYVNEKHCKKTATEMLNRCYLKDDSIWVTGNCVYVKPHHHHHHYHHRHFKLKRSKSSMI